MNKQNFMLTLILCFGFNALMAQQGMQRQTPEERTKATMEKMAVLNLDVDSKMKTEVIISDFYTSQQKAMAEMRSSGNLNRDTVMLKRKEFADARNAKLQVILTAEQYKKWIDDIEPGLRPQARKN